MRRPSGHIPGTWIRALARGGAIAAAAILALIPAAHSADMIAGPVPAEVLDIVDGDTVRVKARIWLGQDVETLVRIEGIDTPEISRPHCPQERSLGEAARSKLDETLASRRVTLTNVQHDKWGGRIRADVNTDAGESVKGIMLRSGHARPYDGGARQGWCGKSQAER